MHWFGTASCARHLDRQSPGSESTKKRSIELGSGASIKVRILLRALQKPAAYVPVDISREPLCQAAAQVASEFPHVPVVAVCADYTRPFPLPPIRSGAAVFDAL